MPSDEEIPEAVNVVLTFIDPAGKRWLAGAMLGPLVAEGGNGESIEVGEMPDVALTLVSFTVVRRG